MPLRLRRGATARASVNPVRSAHRRNSTAPAVRPATSRPPPPTTDDPILFAHSPERYPGFCCGFDLDTRIRAVNGTFLLPGQRAIESR